MGGGTPSPRLGERGLRGPDLVMLQDNQHMVKGGKEGQQADACNKNGKDQEQRRDCHKDACNQYQQYSDPRECPAHRFHLAMRDEICSFWEGVDGDLNYISPFNFTLFEFRDKISFSFSFSVIKIAKNFCCGKSIGVILISRLS